MIPGNVDPRRAEKVQRYKPTQANGNAPVEDLTPDYMNILGPDSATAIADGIEKHAEQQHEDGASSSASQEANGNNVIPTSPQYGVAIISSSGDATGGETTTAATDSVVETTAKTHLATLGGAVTAVGEEGKDMHSTPSRNDRFKVVKIASLEPFRRGRWKCMDYVDENPPQAAGQPPSKQTQSATNIQMGGMQYMQTQSLPQQHFQQMLVQSAFAGSPAAGFYQGVPNQMMQGQYFYPGQTTVISQQVPVQPGNAAGMQQFINSAGQQYFPANVPPQAASAGYTTYHPSNVQYVQPNLIQAQSSAFVPTSQAVPNSNLPANFQQSQTYAGQPSTTQQPMVNGHAFPPGGSTDSPQVSSLPTQIAKNVILQPAIVSMNQTPTVGQNSINQQAQYNPSYQPASLSSNQSPQATPAPPANITAVTQVTQGTPIITPMVPVAVPPSNQISNPAVNAVNQPASMPAAAMAASLSAAAAFNQMHMAQMPIPTAHSAPASSANAMYASPQGVPGASESNSNDGQGDGSLGGVSENKTTDNPEAPSGEDPAKANPVVNAIDNKIEQAMDLVKSHLMYTVREEVEVLKEKIVELMERIQQLETENAYLKQQVLKSSGATPATNGTTTGANDGTPDPTSQTPTQPPAGPQ